MSLPSSSSTDSQLRQLWDSVTTPLRTIWCWLMWRTHLVYLAFKIPGSPALPIIGNLLELLPFYPGAVLDLLTKYWIKYGNVFGMYWGPHYVVSLSYSDDCELVISGNKYLNKGIEELLFKHVVGSTLVTKPAEKWHPLRKALNPTFSTRSLEQFLPIFHNCGDEFLRQLRMRAGKGCVDVYRLCKQLALDVVCETLMGMQINAQLKDCSEFYDALNDVTHLTLLYQVQPWMFTDFFSRQTASGRRFRECLKILRDTSSRVIRKRRAELEELEALSRDQALDEDELGQRRGVCFLDLLLKAARDGHMTEDEIHNEVTAVIIGGEDTTSTAIALTLFLLSKHQDVQEKVLQELQSVLTIEKSISLSMQDLSKLKYMEMVIKESLRIYPPVGVAAREINEDLRLRSKPLTVPAGSSVLLNFWCLHRNPEVFPDPEKFDPERFSPEASQGRHPYAYLPFSAGSRNCIGMRYSMLELKSLLAQAIWSFRILPVPDYEPRFELEGFMKVVNGVSVRLEERKLY